MKTQGKNTAQHINYVGTLWLQLILIATLTVSCTKADRWLDKKSNKNDVVPSTLNDYQALLDLNTVMNADYSSLGQISADNFYLKYDVWQGGGTAERNAYIWAKDIFEGGLGSDWNGPYRLIGYANIALEGIEKIEKNALNEPNWNNIKGSALFYRAYAFYNLMQHFSKPYNPATASTDLGIVLRRTSDVNEKPFRSTVQQCYDQIINDLIEAGLHLPTTSMYQTRPSRPAALALLARVFLSMSDFENAKKYSVEALELHNQLIDFNTLPSSNIPFPAFPKNPEVLFYATSRNYGLSHNIRQIVDSLLYESYQQDDLRRSVFFRTSGGNLIFKGSYTGNASNKFAGIATNELYLILAESLARLHLFDSSMQVLNRLLINRWKAGKFVPFEASTPEEALNIVLSERRKELPFTGTLRWEDLRRLNKEPTYAKTLVRDLNGQVFTLPPNDPKYVLPIPSSEILYSGIEQNPR